ncbi:myeloid differentiation primary response protein MyD88-like isoform X1 [Lineus longissimus]|uniref:myeloid differentiation primary response protein MyD88-like isoform X1 n=1 Tax=Lineus longissimus TaxID=88925 RepID=UPI002B4DBF9F
MASSNPISDEEFKELLRSAPVHCINYATRARLSLFLNPPRTIPARCGYLPDWRGVAELRDFQYQQIQNFQLSPDPTARLLDEYEFAESQDNSVQSLLDILKTLDRFDILDDLKGDIERDVMKYRRTQQRVQDPTVTSNQPDPIPFHNDFLVPEDRYIVVDDSEDNVTIFDAFVCYTKDPSATNDREFVKEMVRVLEGQFGLKLYIMERDLLPGTNELCVSAALIEKRCKRTILVISRAYLQSPECEVHTRSALCFSPTCHNKKILPIFIERNVKAPSVLRPMNAVDMTMNDKQIIEWSWKRISAALKMPLILTMEDKRDEKKLETISFKLREQPKLDSLERMN